MCGRLVRAQPSLVCTENVTRANKRLLSTEKYGLENSDCVLTSCIGDNGGRWQAVHSKCPHLTQQSGLPQPLPAACQRVRWTRAASQHLSNHNCKHSQGRSQDVLQNTNGVLVYAMRGSFKQKTWLKRERTHRSRQRQRHRK